MIYYNSNTINDWFFSTDNIIKVYRNNAICYYKVNNSGDTPQFDVCYAVVSDISGYQDTEFTDVYNLADEKWYKLNNLNQYEEYGVYGDSIASGGTSFQSLQQLIETHTVVEDGQYNRELTPTVSGITRFRLYIPNATTQSSYVYSDLNSDTSTGTTKFALKGDANGTLYSAVGGYNSIKAAADDSNCQWAYWVDADTIEVDVEEAVGTTIFIRRYQINFPTSFISYYVGEEAATTYEGKLAIVDGYEYIYSGSSWVNLGEITNTYVDPNDPIEFEDSGVKALIESKTGIQDITYAQASGITNMTLNTSSSNIFSGLTNPTFNEYKFFTKLISGGFASPFYAANLVELSLPPAFSGTQFASMAEMQKCKELVVPSGYTVCNGADFLNFGKEASVTPTITFLGSVPNGTSSRFLFDNLYPITIQVPNDNINAWKTFIRNNKSGAEDYVVGIDPNDYSYVYDIYGTIEYPKYYDEKSDPLDNLSFNTMDEAKTYAYNNCVYDGMRATIGGDRYYFDSEDENGWVKVLAYYTVEDVTSGGESGWTISGSSTYNPQPSYYDDFDLEATSTSSSYKIAKVTIFGYDHFTYYLRSYHPYSISYAYLMASNVDELSSDPTSMSYSSNSAITNTYNFNKAANSAVNLDNYRRVTYNNLDKTVEHTFYVVFYGRKYSSYVGNATILIPKEQDNENWEQITFSSSTSVASATKSLYIDGSSSSNGGTSYWYYRWMVGLPSGSHTSYTNYSNYDYCPNVTSSTFTSVAGEQRQVNFTYDSTTNKSLQFRLVDTSGNTITPSDTVYYSYYKYNSCNVAQTVNNVTMPRTDGTFKVGGRFIFQNSSYRHHIYGYQIQPQFEPNYTYYNVNDYNTYFDIVYEKLDTEAVTITYTTYDPNDSEVPAFNTDITYPYNGGTTSSTTLTSYDVPYTYSYEVKQSNNLFSASTYSYTAGQASRTISFTLYPNNRTFSTVADMEAYAYAWEGMKASVDDVNYIYENGSWVVKAHSLPDVPFVLNYNAKQYDATTHTISMTEGQLNDTDAVAYNYQSHIVDHSADGYITISDSSMRIRKNNQDISLFNRTNTATGSSLTIVCKAKSTSGENIITNRDNSYNWMYRLKTSGVLRFHGSAETGSISWNTSNPDIMSVRTYYDNGTKIYYNNWTQNTSTSPISFTYGGTNSDSSSAGALFVGYGWSNPIEQWGGDFYWVYMSQNVLTDEQIQQVIDYNENL